MAPHDETLPPNQEATKKLSPSLSPAKDHVSNARTEVEEALFNAAGTRESATAVPVVSEIC